MTDSMVDRDHDREEFVDNRSFCTEIRDMVASYDGL